MVCQLSELINIKKSIDPELKDLLKTEFEKSYEIQKAKLGFNPNSYCIQRLLCLFDKDQIASSSAAASGASSDEASVEAGVYVDADFAEYLKGPYDKTKEGRLFELAERLFGFYDKYPDLIRRFPLPQSILLASIPYIKSINRLIENEDKIIRYFWSFSSLTDKFTISQKKEWALKLFKLLCLFDRYVPKENESASASGYTDLLNEIERFINNVNKRLGGFSCIQQGQNLKFLLISEKGQIELAKMRWHLAHNSPNFNKEQIKNLFESIYILEGGNDDLLHVIEGDYQKRDLGEQAFSTKDYCVQRLILKQYKETNIDLATYLRGEYSEAKEKALFEIVDILWEIYSQYPDHFRYLGAKVLIASTPIIEHINQKLEENWGMEEYPLEANKKLAEQAVKYFCLFKEESATTTTTTSSSSSSSSSVASVSLEGSEYSGTLNELARFSKNVQEKLGGYPFVNKEENEHYLRGEPVEHRFICFNDGIMRFLHPMIVFDKETEDKIAHYYQKEKLVYPISRFSNLFDIATEESIADFMRNIGWIPELGINVELIDLLGFPVQNLRNFKDNYLKKLKAITDRYKQKLPMSEAEKIRDRIIEARQNLSPEERTDKYEYYTCPWSILRNLKDIVEYPEELEQWQVYKSWLNNTD